MIPRAKERRQKNGLKNRYECECRVVYRCVKSNAFATACFCARVECRQSRDSCAHGYFPLKGRFPSSECGNAEYFKRISKVDVSFSCAGREGWYFRVTICCVRKKRTSPEFKGNEFRSFRG